MGVILMELTDDNYYQTKMLSVSSVRLFAQNPARALADFTGQCPWFDNLKALPLGSAFHDMLERAIRYTCNKENVEQTFNEVKDDNWPEILAKRAEEYAADKVEREMCTSDDYKDIRKKNGELTAEASKVSIWFHIMWNSDVMQDAAVRAMLSTKDDNIEVIPEKPFIGSYKSEGQEIRYKGKPDLFIVDHEAKQIDAFDYKTSHPFDPSGMDWGDDIQGNHRYMPIEWMAEKLFPWQAGVYRQLLWDNGYKDYQIRYRYLVITKEKTPRLNVFTISDESMDEGYSQFCDWLVRAHGYIIGDLEAPLIQDGSKYANMQTYKHPLQFTSYPYKAD